MRLIDADVIEKFLDDFADSCGNHQKAVLREVKYALGQLPTIEAVPTEFHDKCQQLEIQKRLKLEEELKDAELIVRCKDCKFYEIAELKQDYTDDKRYKPSVCVKGYYAKPRKGNWYCADGVKRDEVAADG